VQPTLRGKRERSSQGKLDDRWPDLPIRGCCKAAQTFLAHEPLDEKVAGLSKLRFKNPIFRYKREATPSKLPTEKGETKKSGRGGGRWKSGSREVKKYIPPGKSGENNFPRTSLGQRPLFLTWGWEETYVPGSLRTIRNLTLYVKDSSRKAY